jgi:DNA-binding transcriptional LysR family regulator
MPPNIVISSLVEAAFRRHGLKVPQERVASLSMHLRTHLLATGNFLTVMPNSMFRFNAERWSLKALPIDLGIQSRQVGIITLKHRTLSPVVELFTEHARAVAKSIQSSTRPAKRSAVF